MFDLQKANMWKRISAWLFDFILLVIGTVGAALLLSVVLGYDAQNAKADDLRASYEQAYGVDFDITGTDYATLDASVKATYDAAWKAYAEDPAVIAQYALMFQYTILIIVFSILVAFLLLELLVPLLLGNGQTLGKKIFGIGVMRIDGVKLSPLLLFIRTVLGKYTVETMVPVLLVVMAVFSPNAFLMLALIVIGILSVVQLGLLIANPARTPLHDKLAQTVTVDFASQLIFETYDELLAYRKKYNEENKESGQL